MAEFLLAILSSVFIVFFTVATVRIIAGWREKRSRPAIDLSDPKVLLQQWLITAALETSEYDIHSHIVKHAQELKGEIEGNGSYETWSASMHNLLAIYDTKHGVSPDDELRLERMTAKYLKEPVGHVAPPGPVPERIVLQARGPLIEKRRARWKEEAEEKRRKEYYSGGY